MQESTTMPDLTATFGSTAFDARAMQSDDMTPAEYIAWVDAQRVQS